MPLYSSVKAGFLQCLSKILPLSSSNYNVTFYNFLPFSLIFDDINKYNKRKLALFQPKRMSWSGKLNDVPILQCWRSTGSNYWYATNSWYPLSLVVFVSYRNNNYCIGVSCYALYTRKSKVKIQNNSLLFFFFVFQIFFLFD